MASPITHIIFALNVFSLLPATIDKAAFIVGTSFPDIRHKAGISKESTHIEPISWRDIITCTSSFKAGMLFHSLVDIVRIKHFEHYFYDRYSPEHYAPLYFALYPLVLKFAEDALLYDYVQDWHEIINYFDVIYDEELALCSDKNCIKEWHSALQSYFKQKPTFESITKFLAHTGGKMDVWLSGDLFDANKTFTDLIHNFFVHEKLKEFYSTFTIIIDEV